MSLFGEDEIDGHTEFVSSQFYNPGSKTDIIMKELNNPEKLYKDAIDELSQYLYHHVNDLKLKLDANGVTSSWRTSYMNQYHEFLSPDEKQELYDGEAIEILFDNNKALEVYGYKSINSSPFDKKVPIYGALGVNYRGRNGEYFQRLLKVVKRADFQRMETIYLFDIFDRLKYEMKQVPVEDENTDYTTYHPPKYIKYKVYEEIEIQQNSDAFTKWVVKGIYETL